MKKDFLDIDFQIELNEKNLDKYHDLFEQTMGKISLISFTYSVIAIYLVQFVSFSIKSKLGITVFNFSLGILFILIVLSVWYTIKFMIPIKISHLHSPKFFYRDIKDRYENEKKVKTVEVLNKYIKSSYLGEIEQAVAANYLAFKTKRSLFYHAFNYILLAFIPYLVCLSIYLGHKKEETVNKTEIVNSEILLQKIDSIFRKSSNLDSNSAYVPGSQR